MLSIQSLSGNHNRNEFDCGRRELDEWLTRYARQHQERDLSQTFAAVDLSAPGKILGFYALTACEVVTQELPVKMAAKLPRRAPGIKLGRLAVDVAMQKKGLGEHLLVDAITRTCAVRTQIGVHALFVDAMDDSAAAFYRKYGFLPFPDSPLKLVMPLGKICMALS